VKLVCDFLEHDSVTVVYRVVAWYVIRRFGVLLLQTIHYYR
jgi:hypothetical protein